MADEAGPAPPIPKQAWGEPLMRLDQAWTRLESRLCAGVLVTEIAALCLWIALKGLSAEYQTTGSSEKNISGLVFRALLSAIVLGLAAHFATRPKPGSGVRRGTPPDPPGGDEPGLAAAEKRHRVVVTTAVVVGLFAGRLWANAGVEYFSNFLNWMQNASLLMLIGGLRGVVTRLTLWLALLGGSIATAKGKHINIDVVMRFLTPKMRIPVAVLGWVAAAVMCISGAWGFVDHIGIALFHMRPSEPCKDDPAKDCRVAASEKLAHMGHDMATDLFLVGRQLSLDVRTFPRVVFGTKYNAYFTNGEWNTWVKGADWGAHFPADAAQDLLTPPDRAEDKHIPAVSIPGGEEVRGLLTKDADLVFPFGLLMIALRFLLRALLVLAGHIRVDPDLVHEEDEVEESHADSEARLRAATDGASEAMPRRGQRQGDG